MLGATVRAPTGCLFLFLVLIAGGCCCRDERVLQSANQAPTGNGGSAEAFDLVRKSGPFTPSQEATALAYAEGVFGWLNASDDTQREARFAEVASTMLCATADQDAALKKVGVVLRTDAMLAPRVRSAMKATPAFTLEGKPCAS